MHRTSGGKRAKQVRSRPSVCPDRLPTWDPQSDVGKREARRERLSADAVHVIPLVISFCLAVLWFFSLWFGLFLPQLLLGLADKKLILTYLGLNRDARHCTKIGSNLILLLVSFFMTLIAD